MENNTELLSYHNDPAIKEKYITRVREHREADEIVKGRYWEGGKGCAVGCTIHGSDHRAYQTELGIPGWLSRLEDTIFEGLPNAEAKLFPEQFLTAIPIGKNLDLVRWKFCAFILRENIERVLTLAISEDLKTQVVTAIRQCLRVQELRIAGDESAAARSAESAAWSAAESAWSAVWSARSAMWSARSAAWSARSAAWSAAESAAESAESAAESAESAARSAAYTRYAQELLRLLAETGSESYY